MPANVPKQVQDAANAADAQLRTMTGTPEPVAAVTPPPPDGVTPLPIPAMTPPGPVPEPSGQPAEYWQQRFQVIDGKYKAEVPALRQQINELQAQISTMNMVIQSIQAQGGRAPNAGDGGNGARTGQPPAPAAPNPNQFTLETSFSPEEIADFEEQGFNKAELTVLGRMADTIAGKQARNMEARVEQRIKSTKGEATTNDFYKNVGQKIQNWEQVNADPLWLNWLAGKSFGQTRQALLDQASENLNSDGVVEIFELFFKQYPALRSGSQPPQPGNNQNPNPLESQIQPSSSLVYSTPPAERDLSTQEIQEFYSGITAGRFKAMPKGWVEGMDQRIMMQMQRAARGMAGAQP